MPAPAKTQPAFAEFVVMMAMTMSLVALAIDSMLSLLIIRLTDRVGRTRPELLEVER